MVVAHCGCFCGLVIVIVFVDVVVAAVVVVQNIKCGLSFAMVRISSPKRELAHANLCMCGVCHQIISLALSDVVLCVACCMLCVSTMVC